jgi:septum formation protein
MITKKSKSKDILYLGSQSTVRQRLLKTAGIKFIVLQHQSDECGVELEKDFGKYVLGIARHKMESLVLPKIEECEKNTIFVLTADTLAKVDDYILGKPEDLDDAKRMLKLLCSKPAEVLTGVCLEKKGWKDGMWVTEIEKHWVTKSTIEFCVDEDSYQSYFKKVPEAMVSCGAGRIEGFGESFLKSVNGSYTTILGLPMFEVLHALKEIGFKK